MSGFHMTWIRAHKFVKLDEFQSMGFFYSICNSVSDLSHCFFNGNIYIYKKKFILFFRIEIIHHFFFMNSLL